MPSAPNPRALRWLRAELPGLVAGGTITAETARALEDYYAARTTPARNFGFALLATVGAALVAAGIVLLVAHNWDEFSRPLRSALAFLPLLVAQGLIAFVLLRREASKAWRESAALFNMAGIGAAISLVSQAYQIQGSLANFILVWMLLGLPLVYLLRSSVAAALYLAGAVAWLVNRGWWRGENTSPLLFWLLLALVLPHLALVFRRARAGRETLLLSTALIIALGFGVGATASFAHGSYGILGFAGLFTLLYLAGIECFRADESDTLPPLALLGGLAVGGLAVVLTFQEMWRGHFEPSPNATDAMCVAIELASPLAALALAAWSVARGWAHFSFLAAVLPLVTAIGWVLAQFYGLSFVAAVLLNVYALGLGVELIARGLRAGSVARANFGLLVLAALAVARFFDSDLSFVVRAVGFIVIGLGFLGTNLFLFRKRSAA